MAAIIKGLANVFVNYANSTGPSREDIQKAFENFCALPPRDEKATGPVRIPSNNFVRIAETLRQFETLNRTKYWSSRPRIFTVLFGISRTQFMPIFIERGFTDFHLPFAIHDLPQELGDHRYSFIEFQRHVESAAKEIELGVKGHHVSLRSGDDHFVTQKYLGAGGFGGVDVVWSRLSHRSYARKRFRRGGNRRDDQELFATFVREISALKRLSHKHLVRIIGSYTDSSSFAFLMNPVADCNLKWYLDNVDANHFPALRSFFGCLANAISYLHSKRIHHMDIKLENFLIRRGEIFIADFGSAHDWSRKDRSKTWKPMPATERYKPPELAKDIYAPKNSATDIWSLGIVFLEMVSVLRGRTISEFREHLKHTGTGHQFVYANPPGTASWTAELQQKGRGPDSDNEPLQWVHDMTRPHPIDRPTARNLMDLILNSPSAENFRQICCAEVDDFWHELSLQDATQHQLEPEFDEESNFIQELLAEDAKLAETQLQNHTKSQSIQAWLNHDVGLLPTHPEDKAFEDPVSEDSEISFEIEEDEEDLTQVPTVKPLVFSQVASRLNNFDFLDQEPQVPHPLREWGDYEGDELCFEVESDGCTSKYSEVTVRPFEIEEDIPEDEGEDFLIAEDEPDIPYTDTVTAAHYSETSPRIESPAKLEGTRIITETVSALPTLGTRIGSHNTKEVHFNLLDPFLTSKTNSKAETAGGTATRHTSNSAKPDQGAPVSLSDSSKKPTKQVDKTSQDTPTREPPESTSNHPKEAPSKADYSATKDSTKGKDSSTSTKGKGAPKLTLENLSLFNSQSKPASKTEPVRTSKGVKTSSKVNGLTISAAKYIQEIYEAESSAATSVVSETTKTKLSGSATIMKYQDKSFNYVGQYTKKGSSGAVRLLMEKGCNPGTMGNPRPGPVFLAVRGGTPRHTKCLRVLIEFGADINVEQSGTGKTPLHFAIEHQYFKGYGNLLFELLSNGANPNSKDRSGEYPLLKILYGGYEVLERHRRDALALLLYYGADVDITPPGTLNKPIHLAVRRKDPWAVGMLLEKGALLNEPNGAGITPFALAVTGWSAKMTDDQKEVARQLLYRKAPVDQKIGSSESTALQLAITYGKTDMVKILVEGYGADPTLKDKAGQSAFDIARVFLTKSKIDAKTHGDIMKILLGAKSIEVPVEKGYCPITTAVKTSDTSSAKKLLKFGSDANHKRDGESLLDIAISLDDTEMQKLLKKYGAKTTSK